MASEFYLENDYEDDHFCPSVRPSKGMEQLCSHWRDLRDISYLRPFENLSRKFKYL
jgi:hypothetical protein